MRTTTTRTRLAGIVALAALALTGCSGASTTKSADTASASASTAPVSGPLTIFAAASLTGPFDELAKEFNAKYPDVQLNAISYDGSSTLATQINNGAPVDIFASADKKNMDKVVEAGNNADQPQIFTSNVLEIAVAPGDPKGVKDLADLTKPDTKVVLCAPEVPCGNAAKTLLEKANVSLTPVSEEQNVKSVLTKVQGGEADAGLVYVTDVKASDGKVDGVPIANAKDAINDYFIADIKSGKNPQAAKAFQEFVLSDDGQKLLEKYGFAKQ